jgi:hypothetical protein
MFVDGRPTDQAAVSLELRLALLVEEGDDPLDLGHDFGADAIARQKQKRVRGHRYPPSHRLLVEA